MKRGIKYKETIAMPGSNLHKHLTDGEAVKAEQVYWEVQKAWLKATGEDGVKRLKEIEESFKK